MTNSPALDPHSGHFSSGRSNGHVVPHNGALFTPSADGSDRWGPEGEAQPYPMVLPEDGKPDNGLGTPLIQSDRFSDVEKGGKVVPGTDLSADKASRGAQEFGRRTNASKDVREHVKAVIEQNEGLTQPFVVRNLTLTYFLTVLVVIILSLGGQIAIQFAVDTSYSDAAVVNVSGRQRMLSQLIAKDVLAIQYGIEHGQNVSYYVDELSVKLPLWNASYYALLHGNSSMGIPKTTNKAVLTKFSNLSSNFDAIVKSASAILVVGPNGLNASSTNELSILDFQVGVILVNERNFWKTQDVITKMYQDAARSHLNSVLILSWVLHALVIVTLLLEGVFVFRPVLKHMQGLIDERFTLLRRSLENEAEHRGVSVLMMGYISHELQQPLMSLKQHLSEARSQLSGSVDAPKSSPQKASGPSAALESIEKGRVCCELMTTVVGDVANLRNIELGRMNLAVEMVDVQPVVQEVVESLLLPEGVSLNVQIDPQVDQETRQLDKHRLQQVLLNLLCNAFSNTPPATEGGEGEVLFRIFPSPSNPNLLRIEVTDGGCALTPDQQEKLYEPLMDSSGVQEGSGSSLSLYVVKMLVELQGGKVGVEGSSGGGSGSVGNTHWVELPSPAFMKPSNASSLSSSALAPATPQKPPPSSQAAAVYPAADSLAAANASPAFTGDDSVLSTVNRTAPMGPSIMGPAGGQEGSDFSGSTVGYLDSSRAGWHSSESSMVAPKEEV